jgi:DNA (cytosine-5)-methyltransferase 1
MNYLSVCSGIEAATCAWHDLGWKPVGFSEIEPFPSAVLKHHYPLVPNLGDMTKYKEWNLDSVGLLVGGTPCQSFSVAGLRKGLEDPRGNLALTYVGILDKFRPKWCIWENVPGVLSSNGGRDFGSFLGALAELGYGFSYRVLDAQNFGVPQRRRRVFVVGCLGDWESAARVLFESESLCGDTKKSRSPKQETPKAFIPSVANCLQTTCNDYSRADGFNMIAYETHPADSRVKEMGDVCQTVTSRWGTGGGNVPLVQTIGCDVYNLAVTGETAATLTMNSGGTTTAGPKVLVQAYSFDSLASNSMKSPNPHSGCRQVELSKTLDTTVPCPSKNQGGIGILQAYSIREDAKANNFSATPLEVTPALQAMQPSVQSHHAQTFIAQAIGFDAYNNAVTGNVSKTLDTGQDYHHVPNVYSASMAVRRLTPTECERLQGFKDDYTIIPWKKGESPDGHRYKALGNSMAVPVMKWIGERINEVNKQI